jgi:hypothetical protein
MMTRSSCSDVREKGRSSAEFTLKATKTHVGPVGGSLCVDGNSSEKSTDGSVNHLGRHYWYVGYKRS